MIEAKTLCLNMIVCNEMTNIERCLSALVDHIDCWVIADTGSTDGTQDFIGSFFAERKKPGELHSFPFQNFEQARNAALDRASASTLDYDYLLLADADMELVVEDTEFRKRLEGPGYLLLQRSDAGLAYWNTRLVRRNANARYCGVTHEYIDVPGGVKPLEGVWYKDHASGSNREGKFERDIKLLSAALEQDPENHRFWFYLAQSYRDARRTAEAAHAYAKRAEMGGWDEEAWNARLQEARCLRTLGDENGFVRQALAAFDMRPQRAEPLYDLARFYREKGMYDASVLFSEAGLTIERPEQDILFLEDFVYTAGLKEEYSVAANYARDPARNDRGFATCNWLALNRAIPARSRELARSNLFFYVRPAGAILPSLTARRLGFDPPHGYRLMNPSVTRRGQQIMVILETVLGEMTEDDSQHETSDNAPIQTRNFLLRLSDDLDIESAREVLPPEDAPEPARLLSRGSHDLRLFTWCGALWESAALRESTAAGWFQHVLARIDEVSPATCRLTEWRVLRPEGPGVIETNWVPRIADDRLQFVYLCDPTHVVDEQGSTVADTMPAIAAEQFKGGSQLIAFDGVWLALIHEVQLRSPEGQRFYQHRFVWFDATNTLRRVSRPFFFHKKGVELAAGLAWHTDEDRLLISYGVADSEAWIATVNTSEVRGILEDAEHLPSGKSAYARDARVDEVFMGPHSQETLETVSLNAAERRITAAAPLWSRKLRFHILGIPHTASNKEYLACAYTQKVVKLCRMLKERGHTVIHYGNEASDVVCDEHVTVTTEDDLIQAYGFEEWKTKGFRFDSSDHAYQTFFRNAIAEIGKRKAKRDFLLCMWGAGHKPVADAHSDMIVVEPGVGYAYGQFARFKVFESYAVLHACYGVEAIHQAGGLNYYSVVIPNFFNADEFEFSSAKDDYFLYLGRVIPGKGVHIALQVVDRIRARLVVAGQGSLADLGYDTSLTDVEFVGFADLRTRKQLMSRAKGLFLPSEYIEPFGGVQIESLLSGTPTITTDWGAFAENNLHGVTGYRCRTFDHFVWAAENIGRIDPYDCRRWAEDNFSVERLGEMYEEFFQSVMDVHSGRGWYEVHPGRTNLNWLTRYFPNGKP